MASLNETPSTEIIVIIGCGDKRDNSATVHLSKICNSTFDEHFFQGALAGGVASLLFMAWLCIGAQSLISSGDITFPEKSVSTEGCHYQFTPKTIMNMRSAANLTHTE